jgi:hypothetical protein
MFGWLRKNKHLKKSKMQCRVCLAVYGTANRRGEPRKPDSRACPRCDSPRQDRVEAVAVYGYNGGKGWGMAQTGWTVLRRLPRDF